MFIYPRVEFKAIEGHALGANRNLDQSRPDVGIEAVPIHPDVGWRIAKSDQTRQQRAVDAVASAFGVSQCAAAHA
jgi:hypothetical protein